MIDVLGMRGEEECVGLSKNKVWKGEEGGVKGNEEGGVKRCKEKGE